MRGQEPSEDLQNWRKSSSLFQLMPPPKIRAGFYHGEAVGLQPAEDTFFVFPFGGLLSEREREREREREDGCIDFKRLRKDSSCWNFRKLHWLQAMAGTQCKEVEPFTEAGFGVAFKGAEERLLGHHRW